MSNPLLAIHESAGAEFQGYADLPIVLTFGEPQAEYAAIRKSVAIMDLAHRGVLELTGRDRLSFLNNLITNQTWDNQAKAPMPPHTGVYAFMLTPKGRIITDMNVIDLGDRTLLEMDARHVEPTRQLLEKYRFSEQVSSADRSGQLHELLLMGSGALGALNRLLESPVEALAPLGSATGRMAGHEVVFYRDDISGVPGYVLIVPVEAAEAIWRQFTANPPRELSLQEARPGAPQMGRTFQGLARPVGWAAFNTTRIEAGRPLFEIDFDNSTLPAETGQLERAVSFTKGCYVGQEIVARMHARGQVARQIVGIRMDSDALPIAGSKMYDDEQNEVGAVTSSTLSPVLSEIAICLGLVKRPFHTPGSRLRLPAEGAFHEGVVVELPFVKA